MSIDINIFYFFNNLAEQTRVFDVVIVFLAQYLPYLFVGGFLLLLFYSVYSKREKIEMFWVTTLSLVLSRGIITEIIRFFYHRPRPFLTIHAHKLLFESQWFYSDTEWSFPSGHSAFFFAFAMAIFLYNKRWGAWFFVAAVLINVSRIIAGVHYPSDILGGAIIGILSTLAVYYVIQKRKLTKI